MKKKTAKLLHSEDVSLPSFNIEINGHVYGFHGMSELEGVGEAIQHHIDDDKEFTDFINLFMENEKVRKYYAPAMLCGLGYLERDALLDFLVETVVSSSENPDGP